MVIKASADKETARLFATMMLMSACYFPLVFGDRISGTLERMFMKTDNLFSHRHVKVYEHEGQAAAMLLGYDYDTKRKEDPATGWLLFRYLGFGMLRRLPALLRLNRTVGVLDKGEFYISNIAVFERYRHRGFAGALLEDAAQEATRRRLRFLTLDVEQDNLPAIRLYRKLGYEKAWESHADIGRGHVLEFLRLKKQVS